MKPIKPTPIRPKKKLSDDISFIDPSTGQVRCTYNGCIDKFTIKSHEIKRTSTNYPFVYAFTQCSECGQKIVLKGDKSRAFKIYNENRKELEAMNKVTDMLDETITTYDDLLRELKD